MTNLLPSGIFSGVGIYSTGQALLIQNANNGGTVLSVNTQTGMALNNNLIVNGVIIANNISSVATSTKNVKNFGATGDGVTDDYPAISAALNDIPSTGGVLYFPAGTYLISTQITVSGKNITIAGDGMEISIITRPSINSIRLIEIDNMTGGGVQNISLHGNVVFDPNSPDVGAHLLKISTCNKVLIYRVLSKDVNNGSCIYFDGGTDNVALECVSMNSPLGIFHDAAMRPQTLGCRASNHHGDPGYGIQFKQECQYGVMAECIVNDCDIGYVIGTITAIGSNNLISNCIALNNVSNGFWFTCNKGVMRGCLSDTVTNSNAIVISNCDGADCEASSYNVPNAISHISVTDTVNSDIKLTNADLSQNNGIQVLQSTTPATGNRLYISRMGPTSTVRLPFIAGVGVDVTQNIFSYNNYKYGDGLATFTNDGGANPTSVVVNHYFGVAPNSSQIKLTFNDNPQSDWWISAIDSTSFTVNRASSNNTAASFNWVID